MQANTYVCLDSEIDENRVDSCTSTYNNTKQKYNGILNDNKKAAVVCVMIADDKSFTSTTLLKNSDMSISPTIQDLLKTLNNVLTISNNNTDNYSIMSLPEEHRIDPTVLDQTHTLDTNLSTPNDKDNNTSLKLQLTDTIMRTPLTVKQKMCLLEWSITMLLITNSFV